jgi:REP element-mobilizing transposase RayT
MCVSNYIDIVTGSISQDPVHLLISVPASMSVSRIVQ